ncbi:MAG: hypothetical protein ABH986_04680 [archaeon]
MEYEFDDQERAILDFAKEKKIILNPWSVQLIIEKKLNYRELFEQASQDHYFVLTENMLQKVIEAKPSIIDKMLGTKKAKNEMKEKIVCPCSREEIKFIENLIDQYIDILLQKPEIKNKWKKDNDTEFNKDNLESSKRETIGLLVELMGMTDTEYSQYVSEIKEVSEEMEEGAENGIRILNVEASHIRPKNIKDSTMNDIATIFCSVLMTPANKQAYFDIKHKFFTLIKTNKGLWVQSQGEKLIADFLDKHYISYDYDKVMTLKGTESDFRGHTKKWIRPDFYLTEFNIAIEYWGLKNDPDYDYRMDSKLRLYKESKTQLIQVFREDLKDLDNMLKVKLNRLGCSC